MDLSKFGNIHDGNSKGITVKFDCCCIPVRTHERCAVSKKDGVVKDGVQFFHQRIVGLRDHTFGGSMNMRDNAGVHAVLHAQCAGFIHDFTAVKNFTKKFRRFGRILVVLQLNEARVIGLVRTT